MTQSDMPAAANGADVRALLRNARTLVRSGANNPHKRGVDLVARGDREGAMAAFREAIAATPDAPWSYLALADLLVDLGSVAEAADAYRSALARTPANAVALRESIGRGLGLVGDPHEAAAVYQQVLDQEPGRATATVGLAQALLAQAEALRTRAARMLADVDDLGEDERLLDVALDVAPHAPAVYRRLAQTLARRGERSRAIAVIQVGLAQRLDDPAALEVLADLLAADDATTGSLPDGLRTRLLDLVEHGVDEHPDDVALLERRARLVTRYGSHGEGVLAWRAVVDAAPEVAEWHRQLGDRLAAVGDFEQAGVAYDRAVALGYQVW
jgi:tetratricopeptide (TPR) repeat protein